MAVCQFGSKVLGHSADECRAQETDRGAVCLGCIMNGYEGSTAPSVFHILGDAVRQDSRLDYRFGFKLAGGATASLVFDNPRDFEKSADPSLGRDFNRDEFPGIAQSIATVAERLAYFGFRVVNKPETEQPAPDLTGLSGLAAREAGGVRMRTVTLVRGRRLSGGQPLTDVKVELSQIS